MKDDKAVPDGSELYIPPVTPQTPTFYFDTASLKNGQDFFFMAEDGVYSIGIMNEACETIDQFEITEDSFAAHCEDSTILEIVGTNAPITF